MTEAPNPILDQKEENKDDSNINEQKDNNSNIPGTKLEDQQKEIGDKLINEEKNDTGLNQSNENPTSGENQDPEKIENEDDKKPPEDTEKETEAKPQEEPEDSSQAQVYNLRDFIEQDEEKKRQVELKFRMFVDPLFQSKQNKEIEKEHSDTEKTKSTIKPENSQQNNKVCSPPKSPNKRSPRKNQKEVVRYDRSIFYQSNDSLEEQRSYPSSPSEKIELTVSLKYIGLEGLDSSTPDKAENLRKEEKEKERKLKENEKENEKTVKTIKRPTVPVRYSPRRRAHQLIPESTKSTNDNNLNKTMNNSMVNHPKPNNSISPTQNTKKPLLVMPFSLLSDSDS